MPADRIDRWLREATVELDPNSLEIVAHGERFDRVEEQMSAARVVLLGETNHFVHEKAEFRLWWLRRLAARRRIVVGEELSWFDAQHVARYLGDGDERHLDRLYTFGYRGYEQADRDDSPSGIFKASADLYPKELFKAEQVRFYRALRGLPNIAEFFGFDIGGHDAGYELVGPAPGFARVHGETLVAEAARLEAALTATTDTALRSNIVAMIDSMRYTALANRAATYEALRPALALREDAMKRRLAERLTTLRDDEQLVLLAHAFHLAKDDRGIDSVGVGPGGDQVPSLGHHVAQQLGLAPFAVWWLYGAGTDSQPFPDLPQRAAFPERSLNRRLAVRGVPLVAGTVGLDGRLEIGHLYNQVVPVDLGAEADAIFFTPTVTPLRG
jgi:hypothetical protein